MIHHPRIKTVPANVLELETMKLINAILDQPTLVPRYRELSSDNWQIFVVRQNRGRCYYHKRWITIPVFALHKPDPGFWVYYVAHEFAHTDVLDDNHGPKFMARLQQLCPPEFVHYELGYKPQNASVAGISMADAHKAKPVAWNVDLMDLL